MKEVTKTGIGFGLFAASFIPCGMTLVTTGDHEAIPPAPATQEQTEELPPLSDTQLKWGALTLSLLTASGTLLLRKLPETEAIPQAATEETPATPLPASLLPSEVI